MMDVFFFIAHEIKRVLNFTRNPRLAHILVLKIASKMTCSLLKGSARSALFTSDQAPVYYSRVESLMVGMRARAALTVRCFVRVGGIGADTIFCSIPSYILKRPQSKR